MENIKETWEDLIDKAQVQDKDAPLEAGSLKDSDGKLVIDSNGKKQPAGLRDPTSPVVAVCGFIYQMQNFTFAELNRSARFKDESKLETLGPFAAAMAEIIEGA